MPDTISGGRVQVALAEARFNYNLLPPGVAGELKTTANTIRRLIGQVSADIITVGVNLVAVERKLDHGQFGPWLQAEFQWAERTAQRYMQAAAWAKGKSDIVSHLEPTALYLLASPSTPESVKSTMMKRLERGDAVSAKEVRNLVRKRRAADDYLSPRARKNRDERRNHARAELKALLSEILKDDDRTRFIELARASGWEELADSLEAGRAA